MNKTLALRTVVVSLLGTVMPDGAKTYYQQAQKDHPKIYAVYTLDQIDLTDFALIERSFCFLNY